MNVVRSTVVVEGLPAHCPCRGCAAGWVLRNGVGAGGYEGYSKVKLSWFLRNAARGRR